MPRVPKDEARRRRKAHRDGCKEYMRQTAPERRAERKQLAGLVIPMSIVAALMTALAAIIAQRGL